MDRKNANAYQIVHLENKVRILNRDISEFTDLQKHLENYPTALENMRDAVAEAETDLLQTFKDLADAREDMKGPHLSVY